MTFNVGDTVRCIDPYRYLENGQHYKVHALSKLATTMQVEGVTGWWWAHCRFELVTRACTPAPMDNHAPGAKADTGKVRAALVLGGFAAALWQVARVGTFGANKYSDNGWLSVPNGEARYADAQMRHQMSHAQGETFDPESNLLHLAHEAWNSLARLSLFIKNNPGLKL